ncbi:hypothetical protein RND81_03G070600 [Saponaria officinalis]|uniref:Uncharacterized protein n=1 Tax=Saponaria officinalis TaxID=3572 RepID=A0AAW1M4L8_SAPOF
MSPPHANCDKECLKCVLDWYNRGPSDDEEDDEDLEFSSQSPRHFVPDSLDPYGLGSRVPETEFDDGGLCKEKSPENDDRKKSPVRSPSVDAGCRSGDADSPNTKSFNAYVKRMANKRPKTPERIPTPRVECREVDSPSPSTKKFYAYAEKFLAKRRR